MKVTLIEWMMVVVIAMCAFWVGVSFHRANTLLTNRETMKQEIMETNQEYEQIQQQMMGQRPEPEPESNDQ
jgi:cell division protein FtsL